MSLATLKTETSNKTKTAVEKFKRQSHLSRSVDGQSDQPQQADDGAPAADQSNVDPRQMQRNLSMPARHLNALNLDSPAATTTAATAATTDGPSHRSLTSSRRRRVSTPNLHDGDAHRQNAGALPSDSGDNGVERTETPASSESVAPRSANNSSGSHSTQHHHQLRAPMVNETVSFHEMTGRNVMLSEDRKTATRRTGEFSNAYVFTDRPLKADDELVIKIAGVTEYRGGMTVGMTTTDPATLRRNSLPNDPHKLLDRPEYWAIRRDVHTRPKIGNEISFRLQREGLISFVWCSVVVVEVK